MRGVTCNQPPRNIPITSPYVFLLCVSDEEGLAAGESATSNSLEGVPIAWIVATPRPLVGWG